MKYYITTSTGSTATVGGGYKTLTKAKDSHMFREYMKSTARGFLVEIIGVKNGIIRETLSF